MTPTVPYGGDDIPFAERQCPRCFSRPLYQSRLRWWERPLVVIAAWRIRPLRCWDCGWRGWRVAGALRHRGTGTDAHPPAA